MPARRQSALVQGTSPSMAKSTLWTRRTVAVAGQRPAHPPGQPVADDVEHAASGAVSSITTSGAVPVRSRSWSRLVTVIAGLDLAAECSSSGDHRSVMDCGAALGDRPADGVPGGGEHQPDRAAQRRVEPAERVRRDAHVERARRVVAPAAGDPGRRHAAPCSPNRVSVIGWRGHVHDRRKISAIDRRSCSTERGEQAPPRARRPRRATAIGAVQVARQHARRGRRRAGARGRPPATATRRPKPLEVERGAGTATRRRSGGRPRSRRAARRAGSSSQVRVPPPGRSLRLEHGDVEALLGQADGGSEPVRPAAHDDGGGHAVSSCPTRERRRCRDVARLRPLDSQRDRPVGQPRLLARRVVRRSRCRARPRRGRRR